MIPMINGVPKVHVRWRHKREDVYEVRIAGTTHGVYALDRPHLNKIPNEQAIVAELVEWFDFPISATGFDINEQENQS